MTPPGGCWRSWSPPACAAACGSSSRWPTPRARWRATHGRERCARSPAASRWAHRPTGATGAGGRGVAAAAARGPRSRAGGLGGDERDRAGRRRGRRRAGPRVGSVTAW